MKRVMVIGCPGSGKSTFSKALHKKTSLPLFHLDLMNWNSDRSTVERNIFIERLYKAIQKDEWIIDGDYGSTIEIRLKACDTVFLDYPVEICLDGVIGRRGKNGQICHGLRQLMKLMRSLLNLFIIIIK